MATTATIQYLQLDASYDPIFDPTVAFTDLRAVTQVIETRLKLFLGEWWEQQNLGLPVFQQILGQLGSTQGLTAMTLVVQDNIAGGPYVTGVSDTSVTFVDGVLSITASAVTQFSTTPVQLNVSLAIT